MTVRHFLDITDLTARDLNTVMDLAQADISILGQSMEMAVVQLGGHPIFTRGEEVGFDQRETVEDVTRIMAGYHHVVAARVFAHSVLQRMAAVSSVPIINMLSEQSHPLQALADVLTMRQELGDLRQKTVAWIGDYNNVARSLVEACSLEGMNIRLGCPVGYGASNSELTRIADLGAASINQFESAKTAATGAHAVHTDVFVSMGQEAETAKRLVDFKDFCIDANVMSVATKDAIFMHCLPAHRGVEVAGEVIDGSQSRVVTQAHNRMHAARGLLAHLMGVTL